MYLSGVGTSTPNARYIKAECLSAFQVSDATCLRRGILRGF